MVGLLLEHASGIMLERDSLRKTSRNVDKEKFSTKRFVIVGMSGLQQSKVGGQLNEVVRIAFAKVLFACG